MSEKTAPPPFEFEKSLTELEAITAWFESSQANLDQGIAKFERGMELAQALRTHLGAVENRVEKIRQKFSSPIAADPSANTTAESADTASQTGLF